MKEAYIKKAIRLLPKTNVNDGWIYSEEKKEIVKIKSLAGKKQLNKLTTNL